MAASFFICVYIQSGLARQPVDRYIRTAGFSLSMVIGWEAPGSLDGLKSALQGMCDGL